MTPRIALLVIGDRGMHLDAELSFATQARNYELATTIRVNDSTHELGFCEALREGMAAAVESSAGFDYVFHAEEDFAYLRPFDVAVMAGILEQGPRLFQVALKRGPHGGEPAGGFMEQWSGWYQQRYATFSPPLAAQLVHPWLLHQLFYTTNPNLIRRSTAAVIARFLPHAPNCEAAFGRNLIDRRWNFAYLGRVEDEPIVEHIADRTGVGY